MNEVIIGFITFVIFYDTIDIRQNIQVLCSQMILRILQIRQFYTRCILYMIDKKSSTKEVHKMHLAYHLKVRLHRIH